MEILDFIFAILVLSVVFIIASCTLCMHYDTKKLEEENQNLKEQLKKARMRKSSEEYKKVKEVRNGK